jgi:hypothetical protein
MPQRFQIIGDGTTGQVHIETTNRAASSRSPSSAPSGSERP